MAVPGFRSNLPHPRHHPFEIFGLSTANTQPQLHKHQIYPRRKRTTVFSTSSCTRKRGFNEFKAAITKILWPSRHIRPSTQFMAPSISTSVHFSSTCKLSHSRTTFDALSAPGLPKNTTKHAFATTKLSILPLLTRTRRFSLVLFAASTA